MRTPIQPNGRPRRRLTPHLRSEPGPAPVASGVVRVSHPRGLHARAGISLSQLLARFDAEVELSVHGQQADARRPESTLLLGASEGDAVSVQCRGEGAAAALAAVEAFFASDFLLPEAGAP